MVSVVANGGVLVTRESGGQIELSLYTFSSARCTHFGLLSAVLTMNRKFTASTMSAWSISVQSLTSELQEVVFGVMVCTLPEKGKDIT